MVKQSKLHNPKGSSHTEKGVVGGMLGSISFRCLLLPVILVAIFFSLYMHQQAEDEDGGRNDGKTPREKKIRGNSPTPSPTPAPTAAPTHHEIEVKSHAEVQEHVEQSEAKHPPSHFYTEDAARLMFKDIRYRFPSQSFHNFSAYDKGVAVGVLSAPGHVSRRDVIRKTWAYRRSNVFFLVGGPWENISDEIKHTRDIFWVDIPEGIQNLVIKSQTFVIASTTHLNFHFILKTADDSYLRLAEIERLVAHRTPVPEDRTDPSDDSTGGSDSNDVTDSSDASDDTGGNLNDDVVRQRRLEGDLGDEEGGDFSVEGEKHVENDLAMGTARQDVDWAAADYIGSCVMSRPVVQDDSTVLSGGIVVSGGVPVFPTYASGAGYLVSRKFADCFVSVAERAPILSTIEDANVGLYAEICHAPCQHSDRILDFPNSSILSHDSESNFVVAHYSGQYSTSVENIMVTLHAHSCSRPDADPRSCAEGSYRTAPAIPQPHQQQQQQQEQQQPQNTNNNEHGNGGAIQGGEDGGAGDGGNANGSGDAGDDTDGAGDDGDNTDGAGDDGDNDNSGGGTMNNSDDGAGDDGDNDNGDDDGTGDGDNDNDDGAGDDGDNGDGDGAGDDGDDGDGDGAGDDGDGDGAGVGDDGTNDDDDQN